MSLVVVNVVTRTRPRSWISSPASARCSGATRFFLHTEAARTAAIGEATENKMRRTPACSGLRPAAVWYRKGMSTTPVTVTAPVRNVFLGGYVSDGATKTSANGITYTKRPMTIRFLQKCHGKTGCVVLSGRLECHWLHARRTQAMPDAHRGPITCVFFHASRAAASSRPVMSRATAVSVSIEPTMSKLRNDGRGGWIARPWCGKWLGTAK